MNENARKWVEALRSGRFPQTKGMLHRKHGDDGEDRFCCLGVACALYQEAVGDLEVEHEPNTIVVAYNGRDGALPGPVREWLGLATGEGGYEHGRGMGTSLAKRNDSGASFARIADIIERQPSGLFEDKD